MVKTLGGACAADWTVWSTQARLVVADRAVLAAARTIVDEVTDAVEQTCSRFRDSELARVPPDTPTSIGDLLAELVGVALLAAERTDGAVDPTVGATLVELGYDRDFAQTVAAPRPGGRLHLAGGRCSWRDVLLERRTGTARLTVPCGVVLDLGATAKAWAADRAAARVADELGTGVLVSLGGDLATHGSAPDGGDWVVVVGDEGADEPVQPVWLGAGGALATSSTRARRWVRGGRPVHHIVDPRRGIPADDGWRTVTVSAGSCVEANTASTAAIVRGPETVPWFRQAQVSARLVTRTGRVVCTGGWPDPGAGRVDTTEEAR